MFAIYLSISVGMREVLGSMAGVLSLSSFSVTALALVFSVFVFSIV